MLDYVISRQCPLGTGQCERKQAGGMQTVAPPASSECNQHERARGTMGNDLVDPAMMKRLLNTESGVHVDFEKAPYQVYG